MLKEVESYEKKISEAVNKAVSGVATSGANGSDNVNLQNAIKLWREYYEVATQAQNARNAGNTTKADYLQDEANKIKATAQALKEEADVRDHLEKSIRNYNSAVAAGVDKATAASAKSAADALKEQAKAGQEVVKAAEARQKAEEKARAAAQKRADKDQEYAEVDAIKKTTSQIENLIA